MLIDIAIPPEYANRIVKLAGDKLAVYGDVHHTLLLSNRIESYTAAVALLRGYDSQLSRRLKVAELVDEQRMEKLRKFNMVHADD